jgi:hypothetical protein
MSLKTIINPRKRFTEQGSARLLDLYESGITKPKKKLREELAKELGKDPRSIQIWFQNKRAKEKSTLSEGETKPVLVKGIRKKKSVSDKHIADDTELQTSFSDSEQKSTASTFAPSETIPTPTIPEEDTLPSSSLALIDSYSEALDSGIPWYHDPTHSLLNYMSPLDENNQSETILGIQQPIEHQYLYQTNSLMTDNTLINEIGHGQATFNPEMYPFANGYVFLSPSAIMGTFPNQTS